jgi:hypothetical protein
MLFSHNCNAVPFPKLTNKGVVTISDLIDDIVMTVLPISFNNLGLPTPGAAAINGRSTLLLSKEGFSKKENR